MIRSFIFLAVIAVAAPAFAQTAPTDRPDPGDTRAIRGDEIVVTGSRAPAGTPADRLGSSITVLDSQALQQRQTRVVSDILRDVPGVEVSRAGAVGGLTQVRMRGGEGNHTLVLIDGIEASDPFQGEFDFAQLIADDVARIEVLRGQQSALYGSDAIGGVIHYITASGAERPGLSVRADYGSQDTVSAAGRAAGVAGKLDYALSAAYNRIDGYPVAVGGVRDIGAKTFTGSGKFTVTLADNFRVRGVARYTDAQADSTGSSPTTFAPVDGTGSYHSRSGLGLVRAELELFGGRWTHAATGQINDNRRSSFGGATGTVRTSANKGTRLKGSYDTGLILGAAAAQHRLTLAADFEREEFRNLPPAGPQPLSNTRSIDTLGLVAEYRFSAGDRFSIGGAVRHHDNDRFDDATTYRASGSVKIAEPLRVRAAYGTGIKNPTPFELFGFSNSATVFAGNPDLLPEKSRGWEAGADLILAGERLRIGATYFASRLKNEIFSARIGTASTPGNRTTDSTQRGVEVFVAARIAEVLRVDAAYTYLDAEENGVEEIRRAPHIASVNISWRPVEQFDLTATARYNGETVDSNFTLLPGFGPRVRLEAFTLFNLAASWRLIPAVELFGRVENMLDEDYTEVFGFRTPGRTASAGLRARF